MWQPIETAPKDGTLILLASIDGYVMEASWFDAWYGDRANPGWMYANLDEEHGSYIDATHWMPLPEPPK